MSPSFLPLSFLHVNQSTTHRTDNSSPTAFNTSRFTMPKIKTETPARGEGGYNDGDVQSMYVQYDGGHDSTAAGEPPADGSENTDCEETASIEGGSIG
jgi:hypothetical protein